jgi:hypothetical protein
MYTGGKRRPSIWVAGRLTDQQHHNDLSDRRRGRLIWWAQNILLWSISPFGLQVRIGRAIDAVRDWKTTIITAVAAAQQARRLVAGVSLVRSVLWDCHLTVRWKSSFAGTCEMWPLYTRRREVGSSGVFFPHTAAVLPRSVTGGHEYFPDRHQCRFSIPDGASTSAALPTPWRRALLFAAQGLLAHLGTITQYGDMVHRSNHLGRSGTHLISNWPTGKASMLPEISTFGRDIRKDRFEEPQPVRRRPTPPSTLYFTPLKIANWTKVVQS